MPAVPFRLWLLFIPILLSAAGDIITGTFNIRSHAYDQNQTVCRLMNNAPGAVPGSFRCTVKRIDGYYCPVLTDIGDSETQQRLFAHVKTLVPDAFIAEGYMLVRMDKSAEEPLRESEQKAAQAPAKAKHPSKVSNDKPATIANLQTRQTTEPTPTAMAAPTKPEATPRPPVPPVAADDGTFPFIYIALTVAALLIVFIVLRRFRGARRTVSSDAEAITTEPDVQDYDDYGDDEPLDEAESYETDTADIFDAAPSDEEETLPDEDEADFFDDEDIFAPVEEEPEQPEPAAQPLKRKKRDAVPRETPATKADLADFKGNRILVAEDSSINQKVIAALFDQSGIEIVLAENGQEAIDILEKDPAFGMILMDANMPVKDGFEASREIRANPRYDATVIVALSGDVGSDDQRRMREAGMEEQLAKPLNVGALYDVMYQYLALPGEPEPSAEIHAGVHNDPAILDTEIGLDICGGDIGFYREMLEEFVETYGESDRQVDKGIQQNRRQRSASILFDIIGIAGNIGAEQLRAAAGDLRDALLTPREEAIASSLQHYREALRRLLRQIKNTAL